MNNTKVIKIKNLELTCHACPTVFEWDNDKNEHFYFRLRHGYARIANESKGTTVIEDSMSEDFDGICDWDDVKDWAEIRDVILEY